MTTSIRIHVGLEAPRLEDGFAAGCSLTDRLDALLLDEHQPNPGSDDRVVVDD